MYIPECFEVRDEKEIRAFIESNGFGQLVSHSSSRLFSTHLPFFLSEDGSKLLGHLAKLNPQIEDIEGQEIMVTLQGPHDYISPSWYAGVGVPTWNYQAVHIYGQCKILEQPNEVKQIVDKLTNKYESSFSTPWQAEYNPSMFGAIVGIEITISEIECKYKLSQNRSTQDRQQVITQLKSNGSNQLAEAMQANELKSK